MNHFATLNRWFDQFLQHLEPTQRRELMRRLSQGLKLRNKDRIHQQRDPSGNRFIPRKRDQIGRIKRQRNMFKKIGEKLKTEYSADQAMIGFSGHTASVARVHQNGESIKPSKYAKPTKYPVRELMGFSNDDKRFIILTISEFLKG